MKTPTLRRAATLLVGTAAIFAALSSTQIASAATTPAHVASIHADTYYKNCSAVRQAGVAPLHKGDDGYRPGLDRDGDGIACETGR